MKPTRPHIKESFERIKHIFMQAPIAICALDGPEHVFSFSNPLYDQLAEREVLGKKVREAFSEAEVGPFFELLDSVYETGKPYLGKESSVPLVGKDGKVHERFINFNYYPLHNQEGKINGILALHIEVTELVQSRQNLEKSESLLALERHKLETIFQVSPAAMALWRGPELIFEKVNPKYESIFSGRELLGKSLLEALPELQGQGFAEKLLEVFTSGNPFVGEEVLAKVVRSNGGPLEDRYYDFSYIPITDSSGKPYGVYDHAIDVTDRVLSRQNILESKAEANRANELKSSFLANMSHEIRTPLGAIIGFTDLLADRNLSIVDRDHFVATISRNAKALSRIVDDILDLSKVEAGQIDIETENINFYELLSDVVDLFRERAKAKDIFIHLDFDISLPMRIYSDATRLRQILVNLVGNAIKFTDSGGVTVQVQANVATAAKVTFQIDITDTGIGITKDQVSKLFQPFSQADSSTTRKHGGTGLGLVLSSKLAHAMGGTVKLAETLVSTQTKGSTFSFCFAAEVAPEKPKPLKTFSAGGTDQQSNANLLLLEGVSILLAEDSEDNQLLIHRILTKYGAYVEFADNGQIAIQKISEKNFDVVLMDIQMPVLDGIEATRQLRKSGYTKPIIALTAHALLEEKEKTKAAGCDAHLTKPLNVAELIRTVAWASVRH